MHRAFRCYMFLFVRFSYKTRSKIDFDMLKKWLSRFHMVSLMRYLFSSKKSLVTRRAMFWKVPWKKITVSFMKRKLVPNFCTLPFGYWLLVFCFFWKFVVQFLCFVFWKCIVFVFLFVISCTVFNYYIVKCAFLCLFVVLVIDSDIVLLFSFSCK